MVVVGPNQTREVRVLLTSKIAPPDGVERVRFKIVDVHCSASASALDYFRGPAPASDSTTSEVRNDAKWQLTGRTVLFILFGFFGVIAAVNFVMVTAAVTTFGGLETARPC